MTTKHTQDPARSADLPPALAAHRELAAACRIAREAGALAYAYFTAWHGGSQGDGQGAPRPDASLAVHLKPGDEPVTEADRAVSELCVRGLRAAFPDDAVVSEELPDDEQRLARRRTWFVDPIDGTKDFIAGRPGFSVMLGLIDAQADCRPVLGVVYQPAADRLWYAALGTGAYACVAGVPPQRMRVSAEHELAGARMVSSASVRDPMVADLRARAGIRDEVQIGSVGIKLALIGAGERDLYVNPASKTRLWDTAAAEIILHESGGRLTDLHDRPLSYRRAAGDSLAHGGGLLASNGVLHAAALAQLAPLFAGKAGTT